MQDKVNIGLRALGNAVPPNPVLDRCYQAILHRRGRLPRNAVVRVPNGGTFRVFEDNISNYVNNPDYYIYYFGVWESRPSRALPHLIRPGNVCFDIGANIGWYTILLSQLTGPTGAIHAFEPDQRAFSSLAANVQLNGLSEKIYLNPLALSRASGTAIFHAADETLYSSIHNTHAYTHGTEVSYTVRVSSIDDYSKEHGIDRSDFIKCDVEGSEFDIMLGAERVLSENPTPPVIQLEVNPHTAKGAGFQPIDLLEWLQRKRNYRFYKISRSGKLISVSSLRDILTGIADIFCLTPEHEATALFPTRR